MKLNFWPFNLRAKRREEEARQLEMEADYEARMYMVSILMCSMIDMQAPTVGEIEDNLDIIRLIQTGGIKDE